jgi:hypothetical protein
MKAAKEGAAETELKAALNATKIQIKDLLNSTMQAKMVRVCV